MVLDPFGLDDAHTLAKNCLEEFRDQADLCIDPVFAESQQALKDDPA